MSHNRQPQSYAPRDAALLRYTALYRITVSAIAAKLFFRDAGNAGSILHRLSEPLPSSADEKPLLQYQSKSLPHGYSYAQLTAHGCRAFGVSVSQSKPLTKPSLDSAIAISYASAFGEREYHRARRSELLPLLSEATPAENVPHLVTPESAEGMPAILRVYQAVSSVETCITHLRGLITKLETARLLLPWVRGRTYGIAVLSPTREGTELLRSQIARSGLLRSALIVVLHGPTSDTLHDALRGGKHE